MYGEPPAPATAPPAQADCCQQIPSPTAKALPRSGCVSKGSRDVVTARGRRQAPLLVRHRDLSEVGCAGPAAGPPPHYTLTASQAKTTSSAAVNSARGLMPCLGKGKHPKGPPATPPRACQAPIRLRACIDTAGFGSQPGKEASTLPGVGQQRDRCRDARGCSIPWESPAGIGMQYIGATGQLSRRSCGMP